MELSEKIKNYREEQGYTQEELGKLIGVSHVSISLYEQGKRTPSFNKGLRLAQVLGIPCDELTSTEQFSHYRQP